MSEEVLVHHGILGQRWGVRRYQNKDGSLTTKGKERYHNKKTGMSMFAGMVKEDYNYRPGYKSDTYRERIEDPEKPGSKTWLYPEHSKFRQERYRQDFIDDPDTAYEKVMNKINSSQEEETGRTSNCTKVSSAMLLAKMGYDYDAGRCLGGDANAFGYWFNDSVKYEKDNLNDAITSVFDKMDNNSFGTVDLRNNNGGGHVFNWEKNSKGVFSLYEAQPGKGGEKHTGETVKDCFDSYFEQRPWFKNDSVVRIHDMTEASPNWDHMAEDSVLTISDSGYTKAIYDEYTHKDYKNL